MTTERFNPFYYLLLVASLLFVMTALAHALLPWDKQPAWLQAHGWRILLVEVAAVVLFGLLSMGLDRLRSLRNPSASATMSPPEKAEN